MTILNVSLPEALNEWVEAQTKAGCYGTAGDYVRDLIRRDQEQADKREELQGLITDGLASDISTRSIGDLLETAREQAARST